jgi:uncharacterized phage-like protein YoqJ
VNIAITGHRPQDLGSRTMEDIQSLARHMVRRCAERWPDEPLIFHTGAAIGVDLWVANAVIAMGAGNVLHPPLMEPAIYAQRGWTIADSDLLKRVRGHSDSICVICPQPVAPMYQRRNEHMVDSSRLLVAYWSGKPRGGTYNCIQYARRMDVPVLNALDGFRRI